PIAFQLLHDPICGGLESGGIRDTRTVDIGQIEQCVHDFGSVKRFIPDAMDNVEVGFILGKSGHNESEQKQQAHIESSISPKRSDAMKPCEHIDQIHNVKPHSRGCEDCLKTGDTWIHLRLCLTCGHVGCCDSSKNKHATKHFHATKHPVVRSFEPGESWMWCYVDEVMFEDD